MDIDVGPADVWMPVKFVNDKRESKHSALMLPDGMMLHKRGVSTDYHITTLGTAMQFGYKITDVLIGRYSKICSACRKKTATKLCTGCLQVQYCSKECQQSHWSHGGHKAECEAQRSLRKQHKFSRENGEITKSRALSIADERRQQARQRRLVLNDAVTKRVPVCQQGQRRHQPETTQSVRLATFARHNAMRASEPKDYCGHRNVSVATNSNRDANNSSDDGKNGECCRKTCCTVHIHMLYKQT